MNCGRNWNVAEWSRCDKQRRISASRLGSRSTSRSVLNKFSDARHDVADRSQSVAVSVKDSDDSGIAARPCSGGPFLALGRLPQFVEGIGGQHHRVGVP